MKHYIPSSARFFNMERKLRDHEETMQFVNIIVYHHLPLTSAAFFFFKANFCDNSWLFSQRSRCNGRKSQFYFRKLPKKHLPNFTQNKYHKTSPSYCLLMLVGGILFYVCHSLCSLNMSFNFDHSSTCKISAACWKA